MSEILNLGVDKLLEILPHRYPFFLIDRVTLFEKNVFVEGYKNVTFNEEFFNGHFPNRPIMPGVLIIEALAQMGVVFAKLCRGEEAVNKLMVFSGVEELKFRKPVIPGDKLCLRMELIKSKFGHWKMKGTATVDGEIAVQGILMATEIS